MTSIHQFRETQQLAQVPEKHTYLCNYQARSPDVVRKRPGIVAQYGRRHITPRTLQDHHGRRGRPRNRAIVAASLRKSCKFSVYNFARTCTYTHADICYKCTCTVVLTLAHLHMLGKAEIRYL
jgi:hypothetical protein